MGHVGPLLASRGMLQMPLFFGERITISRIPLPHKVEKLKSEIISPAQDSIQDRKWLAPHLN
jgi:hypothetical protein